ncbi:hypothetical protein [Cellulomonas sp. Root137]|uniref:hypothetical protein n=1 Tax=Cellulomonas sp. Root137 TaxID=1736459 RepID=UPI0006F5E9F7|nr:hypothetical protein [Cellulomonas sp. Root137]KQY46001.1 hypothetical protein ASD18_00450 [Cellulomonas sp. Root137]
MTSFDDAFTAVVRARGVWRDDTPASVLERWSSFVAECEHGYRGDEFAYANEAMSRTTLQAALTDPSLADRPELALLRRRVEAVDARFRPLLVEHAFPRIDPDEWWLRGIVRRAGGRLAQDWKRSFGFDIEVVRRPRPS